jgi:alpha-tubulin suppressor-like RCC1 family protein
LIQGLKKERIVEVRASYYHSLAVSKEGQIFSWGYGALGRLGQGYDEMSRSNPSSFAPKKVEQSIDEQ